MHDPQRASQGEELNWRAKLVSAESASEISTTPQNSNKPLNLKNRDP